MSSPRLKWVVLALAVTAAAVCAFVQARLGLPAPPDPEHWTLVPVSSQEMPTELGAAPERAGVLLDRNLQIAARGVTAGATIRFTAFLARGASLQALFGARHLKRRGQADGASLFISGDAPPELYNLQGQRMARQPCTFSGAVSAGGEQDVTITLGRGGRVSVVIRAPGGGGVSRAECSVRRTGGQVGFRSGQSAVVLHGLRVEDAAGEVLLDLAPPGAASRVGVAALTLLALALLWALEASILGWLLGRSWRAGLALAAWTGLPLALLPLLQLLDLGALAQTLRLGRSSPLSLQLGLVLALVTGARALGLLLASRRLRCREEVAPASLAALLRSRFGAALVAHGLLLAGLALATGAGALSAAGVEAHRALEALATLTAALALPLGSLIVLRWLVPGHHRQVAAAEALSWSPSLAAALVGLALVTAGPGWNLPLHLMMAACGSLALKLLFLQVNARWARGVNWVSLACVALLALGVEGAVRQTYLDTAWSAAPSGRLRADGVLGWKRADQEFDYIVNTRRHTRYPRESYPVAFRARRAGVTRIVCLGGSSTGGAFQMDDLDDFFPARLQRLLNRRAGAGRFEVLNQGVGGWNTFHIRLYLELTIDRLRPDVLVLYVGHNDIMTTAGETYRQFWSRYRRQHSSLREVMALLERSRLVVGYRAALSTLRYGPRGQSVSNVPVPDARENLEAVIELAGRFQAPVVLLSEAIDTPAHTLVAYRRMMSELAQTRGQHYLDLNHLLRQRRHEDLLLDRNHLAASGHQLLAELLTNFLVKEGVVKVKPGAGLPAATPGPQGKQQKQ